MKRILISLGLLTAVSLFAAEQSDPRFEKFMDRSRKIYETNHMVVDLRLSSYDGKVPPAECHYDRYPGKVERIQCNGATFARKQDGKWLQSQDWGESGKPVKGERLTPLNVFPSCVDLPLKDKGESRDQSQGATVVRLIDQHTNEEGDEEFVFEMGRENQTGANYPKYTFLRYKNADPDDAVLYKFSGPIYSQGGSKVQLDARYGYLVAVKMNVVTPTPAAASENSPKLSENVLPAPAGENVYTFAQIEQKKAQLKDKIVRIEILRLLGQGSNPLGDGTVRYIAKDTSGGATPYGQVAFPAAGLEKTGLGKNPDQGPLTCYARVHVFPEKKAAAICVVVGTKVSMENGKATYSW